PASLAHRQTVAYRLNNGL
ncbi:unnamed protein product, partial [Allacma fusca]